MTKIAQELNAVLGRLDPERAKRLESLVRDALALASEAAPNGQSAWPAGYFDETAGAFAGEKFERPPQGETPKRGEW